MASSASTSTPRTPTPPSGLDTGVFKNLWSVVQTETSPRMNNLITQGNKVLFRCGPDAILKQDGG